MEYIKTVENVNKLLTDNNEWIVRYEDYAEKINKNQQLFTDGKKKFHINPPFHIYSLISNLLKTNVIKYDLRFLGQSIADIKIKGNVVYVNTKKKDSVNLKYFEVNSSLTDEKWNSDKASKFRSAFKNCTSVKGHSKEHKVETGLLSEFYRKNKSEKALYNIQPVLLANAFFQMATPLKASLIDIKYSNKSGGGIDILSRVKHKDNSVRLCVMELKDEYTNAEPPEKAMKQAVAYATFIANLLRSESGNNWYKLFGFSGNVPDILIIDVSIVMPYPEKKAPVDFNKERIQILDDTFIELYSLYYKEKSKIIDGYNYEFTGSLKEEMMK